MIGKSDHARQFVERRTKKYGKSKAISILAAKIGRCVYHMLMNQKTFDNKRLFA